MGKNPLDISRKLKRYGQQIKTLRRGIQVSVRLEKPSHSGRPDFALGTYQIKGGQQYSLLINVDLPKKAAGVQIDFYGISGHSSRLEHLNRGLINSVNRDARIRFSTYPKTKHIFMTFKLKLADLEDEDTIPETMTYNVNYIYIDSKHPIPRTTTVQPIPNKLSLEYNVECNPHMIANLDLKNPLKNFTLPINFEVFEHAILTYLLNQETAPAYVESLQQNIQACPIKAVRPSKIDNIDNVNIETLEKLREEIKTDGDKLEEHLKKIDNLIHNKYSLENTLNDPKDNDGRKNEEIFEHGNELLKQFINSINIKLNHISKLKDLNKETFGKLDESDTNNMNEILEYYEKRVLNDKALFKANFEQSSEKLQNFKKNIINPTTDKNNDNQERLDQILLHYRKNQKKSTNLKKQLDEKIITFMCLWYQYIIECNYLSSDY